MTEPLEIPDTELILRFIQNAPRIMWFLGAGTSRTAGMPTATDIIWDLKQRYYCIEENQDIQSHDINNENIKRNIQGYLDSKDFPTLGSPEEYSFYFDLIFKTDYSEQQKYLSAQLSGDKISLNIGHRVIAALLEMKKAPMVFTTNFDTVIERAYAAVTGKDLAAFHLEGSYAALEALDSGNLPIYAKIHGDFRYQSIKNLSTDLVGNDEQIQECFLAAAGRYGLIVSGYSGRDANVMEMFNKALEQNNAFPHGIYWTVTRSKETPESVRQFIEKARGKNINAFIVETGTFDILLSKIWRQILDKPQDLDQKVRTAIAESVSIPLPAPATSGYPLLRTNALLVTQAPEQCSTVTTSQKITLRELNDATREYWNDLVAVKTEKILSWGSSKKLTDALSSFSPGEPESHNIANPVQAIKDSMFMKSFYEEGLARALVSGKPLYLRKNRKQFYAVVDHRCVNNELFKPLKDATGYKGSLGQICGSFQRDIFWSEAVSVRLEEKNGHLWLLLRPDIWVKPLSERQNYRDKIKGKKKYRYNRQSSDFLTAWIRILLGDLGDNDVTVEHCSDTEFPIQFTLNTRSAFSRKEGRHA